MLCATTNSSLTATSRAPTVHLVASKPVYDASRSAMTSSDQIAKTIGDAPTPHVVLVDDDPLFLRTFAANMESAGYKVSAFRHPAEALDNMLKGHPPAACILDWHMPE